MINLSQNDMVHLDFQESSGLELLTVLIIDGQYPVTKFRLQRQSLIFHELYGRDCPSEMDPHFWGGYSDEIDEAVIVLRSKGIVCRDERRYNLTDYGRALRDHILMEYGNKAVIRGIGSLKRSLSSISNKDLIALTYVFYDHVASHPSLKPAVDDFTRTALYDGIPVLEYPKDRFESKLREGIPVVKGV